MGDKERACDFPKGKRVSTLQGDTVSSTHQSDTKVCEGVGANSVKDMLHPPYACFCFRLMVQLPDAKIAFQINNRDTRLSDII